MTDTHPPVPPLPGHWCRRRDGKAFRQEERERPDGFSGEDNHFRLPSGSSYFGNADCIGIIGPICAGCTCTDGRCTRVANDPRYFTPNEMAWAGDAWEVIPGPIDAFDWRDINGVRQAVVPLYGARPGFIRDDDLVRFWQGSGWSRPDEFAHSWHEMPAVILRARDDRNGEDKA